MTINEKEKATHNTLLRRKMKSSQRYYRINRELFSARPPRRKHQTVVDIACAFNYAPQRRAGTAAVHARDQARLRALKVIN